MPRRRPRRRGAERPRGRRRTPGRPSSPARRCPSRAKRDLLRLYTEPADYLPGLTSDQKKARLARMSYADFLTGPAGAAPRRAAVLPDPAAQPLRRRHRRRARAGRLGPRPARLRGPGPRPRARSGHELRRDPPRRGRAATSSISPTATRPSPACWCAALVPAAIPGRTADDVVTGARRLRAARRGRRRPRASASTAPWCGCAHRGEPAEARDGRGHLRAGRPAADGARRARACWPAGTP